MTTPAAARGAATSPITPFASSIRDPTVTAAVAAPAMSRAPSMHEPTAQNAWTTMQRMQTAVPPTCEGVETCNPASQQALPSAALH